MRSPIFNSANVFIAICCLDRLLPIFIPDTPINSLLHWSIIILPIYYAYKVCKRNDNNKYLKYLLLLIIMFFVYGVLYFLFGPTYINLSTGLPISKLSYTTAILKSLLPIYAFYYFTISGKLKDYDIKRWMIVFVFVAIVFYTDMLISVREMKGSVNDVTNNSGYFIVTLLPLLVFLESKKLYQYALFLLCLILVVFSMKRGAILSCVLMFGFFMFKSLKDASTKQKTILLLFIASIVLGLYYYISNFMMDNIYFLSRIEATLEGDTSNRSDLYGTFWKHILNEDLFHQLFGNGANYTLSVSYNYAHNDWLEIGVNQGLFGVIVFCLYWISFFRCSFRTQLIHPYNIMLGMVFIDFFTRTIFSMSYTEHTLYTNICIGYCLGIKYLQSAKDKIKR